MNVMLAAIRLLLRKVAQLVSELYMRCIQPSLFIIKKPHIVTNFNFLASRYQTCSMVLFWALV